MSTLYDILFGKRVPDDQDTSGEQLDPRVDGSLWELVKDHLKTGDVGSNGESNSPWSEQLDPRVDGSLWELVKDHLKAGNIGWGGEFIPPSSGPGLPGYSGDTAANPYARTSFPVSCAGSGRDFRADVASSGDQASPMSDEDLGQLLPEWLKTRNVGWGVETIPPLFTAENPLAPGSSQGSEGLGRDMRARQEVGSQSEADGAEAGDGQAEETDPWNMKPSPQLVDFVANYEDFRDHPYRPTPSDEPTIGYGHQIQPGEVYNNKIDENEGKKILKKDMDDHVAAVNNWAQSNNVKLTQQQFDALVSLDFNLKGGIEDGAEALTALIKSGNATPEDIRRTFGRYHNGPDGPLEGLVNRRADEADMFLAGDYRRKYR